MSVGIVDLGDWGKLRFAGPDRQKFLNGLLTNDVLKLVPGTGQLDCVLTPKGKLVGDFALYHRGEDLFAVMFPGVLAAVQAALKKSIMLSQTTMEDATASFGATLFVGAGAAGVLRDLLEAEPPGVDGSAEVSWLCRETACEDAAFTVCSYPRFRQPAWLLLWPAAQAGRVSSAVEAAVGRGAAKRLSREEFEALRIDSGIPVAGADTDADTFPAEANLDSAISYDKGCYMGQEITSRIKNLGHVNRRLAVLRLSGRAEPGAPVTVAGAEAGRISSAVYLAPGRCVALAMLAAEQGVPGTEVAAGAGVTGTVLTTGA